MGGIQDADISSLGTQAGLHDLLFDPIILSFSRTNLATCGRYFRPSVLLQRRLPFF